MFSTFAPATLLATLFAMPAAALDLDALSGQPKREACAAYIWMEIGVAEQAGALTQQAASRQRNALVFKIWGRNPANAAAQQRSVNVWMDKIVAEDPTVGEVVGKAKGCRGMLGL